MKNIKILVVEDESIIALELKMKLLTKGYESVYLASSGEKAVELANEIIPDLILMDIVLRGNIDGIEAATQIKAKRDIPIIYITGNSHLATDKRLIKTNPIQVLTKPTIDEALYKAIREAISEKEKNSI